MASVGAQRDVVVTNYFTDREFGPRPPSVDIINERVWAAFHSMIETRIGNGSFGYRFPEQCHDGRGPCGCDANAMLRVLAAEVPWFDWASSSTQVPDTPVVLDVLQFCAGAVGEPIQRGFHAHYGHYHLQWDRAAGLDRFVTEVNTLFRRNALAYEITSEGEPRRLLPTPLIEAVGWALFRTGDGETDRLLDVARQRFLSPRPDERQDALEKIWDAFERLKTLEPGAGKRAGTSALLDRVAAPGSALREELETESVALTRIGNRFRIRHAETSQEFLTTLDQVDYLFTRMFAFVRLVLKATGRGG